MKQKAGLKHYGNHMRKIDKTLAMLIPYTAQSSVAACAIGYEHDELLDRLQMMGLEVNVYDSRPDIKREYKRVDIILDDVKFHEDLIIHFNVENTYPIGKVHKGHFLLIYDDGFHKGNCTTYDTSKDVIELIAEDNNISIINYMIEEDKHKTYYIVEGVSN